MDLWEWDGKSPFDFAAAEKRVLAKFNEDLKVGFDSLMPYGIAVAFLRGEPAWNALVRKASSVDLKELQTVLEYGHKQASSIEFEYDAGFEIHLAYIDALETLALIISDRILSSRTVAGPPSMKIESPIPHTKLEELISAGELQPTIEGLFKAELKENIHYDDKVIGAYRTNQDASKDIDSRRDALRLCHERATAAGLAGDQLRHRILCSVAYSIAKYSPC